MAIITPEEIAELDAISMDWSEIPEDHPTLVKIRGKQDKALEDEWDENRQILEPLGLDWKEFVIDEQILQMEKEERQYLATLLV